MTVSDRTCLLLSLVTATCVHLLALSQGFGIASAVTGDVHARLRPLIVAEP